MWIVTSQDAAAGSLKTLFDTHLPTNPYWSIEDAAAGANIGVYRNRNLAENNDYVFRVADNQANYATIQVWEDWDPVAHVGVGMRMLSGQGTTRWFRFGKRVGPVFLSLKNNRLIYITWDARSSIYYGNGYYIGQLKRFDVSKNIPFIACQNNSASVSSRNPLGHGNYNTTLGDSSLWHALWDERGYHEWTYGVVFHHAHRLPATGYSSAEDPPPCYPIKTINGKYRLLETPVYNGSTGKLVGLMDGVVMYGNTGANGKEISTGDIIYHGDSKWMAVAYAWATSTSLVEMA